VASRDLTAVAGVGQRAGELVDGEGLWSILDEIPVKRSTELASDTGYSLKKATSCFVVVKGAPKGLADAIDHVSPNSYYPTREIPLEQAGEDLTIFLNLRMLTVDPRM
jgi:hypothetical protein